MNYKKLGILFVVAFVAFFFSDFLIHGLMMKSTYQSTQNLWRPQMEMGAFMPYMMLGKVFVALFFSWIFMHGYKGKGIMEGIRYGLLITGYCTGTHLIMYSVAPYPLVLVMQWVLLGGVQSVAIGALCTLVADRIK